MLPYIVFAYNSTIQSSINDTPFYLIYGRDSTYPFDLITKPNTTNYDVEDNFVTELRLHMKKAHSLAQVYSQAVPKNAKFIMTIKQNHTSLP